MSQRAKGYLRCRGFVVGLLTLGLLYVPVTVVGTQEAVVVNFSQEKDPVPDGWELSENTGKANLALVPDGGTQALKLRSNSSSFSLNKELGIDLTKTPYLEWQWKVTELPKGGGFPQERHRRSGGSALCGSLLGHFQETGDCLYLGQHRSRGDH